VERHNALGGAPPLFPDGQARLSRVPESGARNEAVSRTPVPVVAPPKPVGADGRRGPCGEGKRRDE